MYRQLMLPLHSHLATDWPADPPATNTFNLTPDRNAEPDHIAASDDIHASLVLQDGTMT